MSPYLPDDVSPADVVARLEVFIDMAKNPTLRIQLIGSSKLAQPFSLLSSR